MKIKYQDWHTSIPWLLMIYVSLPIGTGKANFRFGEKSKGSK